MPRSFKALFSIVSWDCFIPVSAAEILSFVCWLFGPQTLGGAANFFATFSWALKSFSSWLSGFPSQVF
jgi:hypothetical protein